MRYLDKPCECGKLVTIPVPDSQGDRAMETLERLRKLVPKPYQFPLRHTSRFSNTLLNQIARIVHGWS